MGQVWFNTSFVDRNFLVFDKDVIDIVKDDTLHHLFSPNFRLEIFLHKTHLDPIYFELPPDIDKEKVKNDMNERKEDNYNPNEYEGNAFYDI